LVQDLYFPTHNNQCRRLSIKHLKIETMPTKTKKAVAAAASRTPEAESALKELFVDEIKDIYWAEKHLAARLAEND
jgi:hypothetical protein